MSFGLDDVAMSLVQEIDPGKQTLEKTGATALRGQRCSSCGPARLGVATTEVREHEKEEQSGMPQLARLLENWRVNFVCVPQFKKQGSHSTGSGSS